MRQAACRKEDIIAAFEDMCRRLEDRRTSLWRSYGTATRELTSREYSDYENECWDVLHAGLAGIDAEQKMLERDYQKHLERYDQSGALAS